MAVAKHGTEYITSPLTREQIEEMQEGGYTGILTNIAVDIYDILDGEGKLCELISELVTGTGHLQEIEFKAVDIADDGSIILEITGWVDENDLENYF